MQKDILDNQLMTKQMPKQIFNHLSKYLNELTGIQLPPNKRLMLTGRIRKRVKLLGLNSFKEYSDFVFSNAGKDEIVHMVDVVTTNKTDFFREPDHFDYIVNKALPNLIHNRDDGLRDRFIIWSAGCSTGEEPYTLAMVLNEFAVKNKGFKFVILATDISTQVLSHAERAVYTRDKTKPIPHSLKMKYLLRSKNSSKDTVRIGPELRSKIKFHKLNFLDRDFNIHDPIDIIFCRNVIIYFNKKTQEKLLNKFSQHLVPGGYMFIGHSETLNSMNVPFTPVAPTVYQKI